MAEEVKDWADFERKARVVEIAERIYGKRTARLLWEDLGLPLPQASSAMTAASTIELAAVSAFVGDRLVVDDQSMIGALDLHRLYQAWAEGNGSPSLTLAKFGRLMGRLPVRKFDGRHITYGARPR